MHKTNLNVAFFLSFRNKNFNFFGIFEKHVITKSKIFVIRKISSQSVFLLKKFEKKFWSLHHDGIWFKCLVKLCQEMTDHSSRLSGAWLRYFPIYSRVLPIDCHVQLGQV